VIPYSLAQSPIRWEKVAPFLKLWNEASCNVDAAGLSQPFVFRLARQIFFVTKKKSWRGDFS